MMDKEKKGGPSCDPGWNDPPMFSYESQTAQLKSSKPRTLLTKRVAFPLNESSPPTANRVPAIDPTAPLPQCNISTLPPPPTSFPVPVPLKEVSAANRENDDFDLDQGKTLLNVMSNLRNVLIMKFEEEEKDKVDIQRRLDIMEKMWKEDKLCKDIQQRLLELSEALLKNEIEAADNLQKGLMVDHGPECSVWMSGIRRLIHHKLQLTDNTSEEQKEN